MMTVHELSGGRAILGMGVGGSLALAPLGISPVQPLATMRQAMATMRAVVRGERGDGYMPPAGAMTAPDLPLFIGSRSPRINRLASALADGAFVAGLPISQVAQVVGWARSVRDIPISLYVSAAFEVDDVERARPEMVWALVNSPDASIALTGHPRSAFQAATEALQAGDREPARKLMTDGVLRQVLLWGEPHELASRLAQLARALQPTSIGLCLLQSDVPRALAASAAAFTAMHHELSF
jgi:5,10-methylenetetrahydromethanopterin reductase